MTECEWPVQSWFDRPANCSRSATSAAGRLALCWQHQDALIHEVVSRINDDTITASEVRALSGALRDLVARDPKKGSLSSIIRDILGKPALLDLFRRAAEGAVLNEYGDPDEGVESALTDLVTARAFGAWGAAS